MHLKLASGAVNVTVCRTQFTAYNGRDTTHTFGGKDLLLVDGRPQFAEVAILRLFQAAGWQGRWLETYPYRKHPRLWLEWKPGGCRAQEHVPIQEAWVNEKLQAIAQANGGYFSGCWDVVAWKNDRLVFAESKKRKKDAMRGTQLRWLEAALKCGCSVEDFVVVEWDVSC
ncbi:MAG: hypothetical protein JNN32_06820 [Flavobacteriales bacterium]|nr:hypothetical protein [Flavobacteriales bacterium]